MSRKRTQTTGRGRRPLAPPAKTPDADGASQPAEREAQTSPAAPIDPGTPTPAAPASAPAATTATATAPRPKRLAQMPVAPARGVAPALDPRLVVPAMLLAGLVIRLVLAPVGSFQVDAATMRFWAERLALLPISEFYATEGRADHLPGDIWILWYIANVFRAFSPQLNLQGDTFLFLLKLVPILADVGVGAMLYLLGRRLGGTNAGLLAAALYLFNPGPIFLASIWGQWDAISIGVALLALWLLLRGNLAAAAAALTYAALIKPQFAALAPLFTLAYLANPLLPQLRRVLRGDATPVASGLVWSVARGLGAVASALATLLLVPLPFGVGLPPLDTPWSLWERMRTSWDVHPYTSLNAFNLWATPLGGNGQRDSESVLFGISAHAVGQGLLILTLIAILALYWRRSGERALVWGSLATMMALFILPTRVHERYLLPAVALAALAAAIAPGLRWFMALLSGIYVADIVAVYAMAHDDFGLPFFREYNPLVILLSLLNVALFALLLLRGRLVLEDTRHDLLRRRRARPRRAPALGAEPASASP